MEFYTNWKFVSKLEAFKAFVVEFAHKANLN